MTTALIFGHSSGLGHALTAEFTSQGHEVIGVARSVCDIASPHVTNLTADLAQQEEVHRIADLIHTSHANFDVVVFAAGILTSHEIEALDYRNMQELYQLEACRQRL